MPKPKLSDQQKVALRGEIKKKLKNGQTKSTVMADLAPKYKISTETVRYHINAVNGRNPKRKKKARRASGAKVGILRTILRQAEEVTEQDLAKVMKAKKLESDLSALKEREKDLKRQLRGVESDKRKVAKKIRRALS